jgi:signal transduction histidine kinase
LFRAVNRQLLGDVHDLSLRLRPSAIDDFGLIAALQKHCRTVADRSRITVDCQTIGWDGRPRLPAEVELAVYRIVQEAVSNAVRHGEARSIQVLLQRRAAALLVVIEDDGCGFDATDWRARCYRGGHLGLLGMEERAALLGGTLRVESHPSSKTNVFVEIPIEEEVTDGEDPGAHRR